MTKSCLAANRRPRNVVPRSPRIINSRFYKGGQGARSEIPVNPLCTELQFGVGKVVQTMCKKKKLSR